MYQFGSVAQNGKLLLWNLKTDDMTGLLHPGSSSPLGFIQPSPKLKHLVPLDPFCDFNVVSKLLGLIVTQESLITGFSKELIRVWKSLVASDKEQ